MKTEIVRARGLVGKILRRMRWDDQGGYSGYNGNGKWSFVSTSLPQTSPDELNELFAFAGIVPDVIVSIGACVDCGHAKILDNGTRAERGYAGPCSPCKRPKMSNFVPVKSLKKCRTCVGTGREDMHSKTNYWEIVCRKCSGTGRKD